MCNRDLDNLRKWKPDDYLSSQRAEVLTPQGVEDMKLLARRLQSNFPELLQPSIHNITSANYKVSLRIIYHVDRYVNVSMLANRFWTVRFQSKISYLYICVCACVFRFFKCMPHWRHIVCLIRIRICHKLSQIPQRELQVAPLTKWVLIMAVWRACYCVILSLFYV